MQQDTIERGAERFLEPDGSGNGLGVRYGKTESEIMQELGSAPDGARYGIYAEWKDTYSAHVFVAEKQNGVLRFIDPQDGNVDVSYYFEECVDGEYGIFRMDDAPLTADRDIWDAIVEEKSHDRT